MASLLQNDEVLVPGIRKLLEKEKAWLGNASELKARLQRLDCISVDSVTGPMAFPKTPNALSAKLKRLTPALEADGILRWPRKTCFAPFAALRLYCSASHRIVAF